jgi:hypothetical protein
MIFAFLLLTTIVSSDTLPSASIHLELGKDTLALAEPTLLTVTLTNNQESELIIEADPLLNLIGGHNGLSLFLITPDGEQSEFKNGMNYTYEAKYWLLPPQESLSAVLITWWTPFVPLDYTESLEKLPSGNYKLFASYDIPDQGNDKAVAIYSDTIEFVFLPLNKDHRRVIKELNSLSMDFMGLYLRRSTPTWQRIRDSNTPYSEAAWAMLVTLLYRIDYDRIYYDSLEIVKKRFCEAYPNSQFMPYIQEAHFRIYKSGLAYEFGALNRPKENLQLDAEADSLLEVLGDYVPKSFWVHKWKTKLPIITEQERRMR